MPQFSEIETLNNNFLKYLREFGMKIPSQLNTEGEKYSEFIQMLTDFYVFMAFLVDDNKKKPNKETQPVMIIYGKTSLALFAVSSCLKKGLIGDTYLILRGIFENWLNIEMIFEDSWQERAQVYSNYSHIEKYLHTKNNLELVTKGLTSLEQIGKSISPFDLLEIERNYLKFKDDYNPRAPYHWAWKYYKDKTPSKRNPSVKFLAEYFDDLPSYYRIYGSTSAYAHGSVLAGNLMRVESGYSLAPEFSDLIFSVGYLSLHFCARIIHKIIPSIIPKKSMEIIEFTYEYEYKVSQYAKSKMGI